MKDVLWIDERAPEAYLGYRIRFSRYTRREPASFYPDEVLYVKVEGSTRPRYAVYYATLEWRRPTIN